MASPPTFEIESTEPKPDLKTLHNELHSMSTKWFQLGVQLDIGYDTLTQIEKNFHDHHVDRCFMEMLNIWRKDNPSWKVMVEALKSEAIAEEKLAKKLERKFMHQSLSQPLSPTSPTLDDVSAGEPNSTQFPIHHVCSLPTISEEHTHPNRHRLSLPCNALESDPTHKLLSKELKEKFLPSIQKLREEKNIKKEIETHRRHDKVVNRIHKELISGKQKSEEAQVLEEILQEKQQKLRELEQKLKEKDLEFKQAEDNMIKLRGAIELDESVENREPITKKMLAGAWRIASTEDRKLLATTVTVEDGKDIGRVALLERQGGILCELKKQMVQKKDTCEWTPAGIAVDKDNIFVGDVAGAVPPGRTRKQLIDATTETSDHQDTSKLRRFKRLGGEQVSIEQPLGDPSGMAFRDKLYVCDRSNHQIMMLNRTKNITTMSHFGEEGTGEGQFQRPTSIAFDDNGDMYVLDQGNRRVQVFSPDFRFLREFGSDKLIYPAYDLHVSEEFVYVTQTEMNRVLVFDKQYGIFVASFSAINLKQPVGIVADKEGYIYVCGASNIWVF